MNETELRPCPFCGGKAELNDYMRNETEKQYTVECALQFRYCSVIPKTWGYDTAEEAIEAWNHRYD